MDEVSLAAKGAAWRRIVHPFPVAVVRACHYPPMVSNVGNGGHQVEVDLVQTLRWKKK